MPAISVPPEGLRTVKRVWVWILVALVATVLVASQQVREAAESQLPPNAGPTSAPTTDLATGIGFRNRGRLEEHYRKHGREFGDITQAEYLRRAQELRDAPVGGSVLELRREDGVLTRFDRESGSFIAFDPDRTIRTFFRPNAGERYFRRQAARDG